MTEPTGEARPRAARRFQFGGDAFRTTEEHVFDAEMLVGADGHILAVSARRGHLLGYDLADTEGVDIFALVDESDEAAVRASWDDLLARRKLTAALELRAPNPDGQWVDVEIVASNHLDDEVGAIVVHLRDITERKRLEATVREAERRHSLIIDSLVDGVMMVDADGVVVRVNRSFEAMFATDRTWLVGRRLTEVHALSAAAGVETIAEDGRPIEPDDHPVLQSLRTGDRFASVVHGIRQRSGATVWISINAQPITGPEGPAPIGAVASFNDITELRQASAELHRDERFLTVLLENLEEGIVACDREGRITVFNSAAKRLHGLAPGSDPVGKIPSDRGLRRVDGARMARQENPLLRALTGERLRDVQLILETRRGEQRLVSVNAQALADEADGELGAVVAVHDITEQKRNEERLAELALHDPLTGLANRTLLGERLRDALEGLELAEAGGTPGEVGRGLAVFLLDLDNFKEVNDALGHDVGDDVLVAVARRLTAIVRPSDTVARLGGDEFVVVCEVKQGDEEKERIAERIADSLAEPYRIDGRTLHVLASVGGVVATGEADASKLLSQADDAMYAVKWARRRERRELAD